MLPAGEEPRREAVNQSNTLCFDGDEKNGRLGQIKFLGKVFCNERSSDFEGL